MAVRKPSAVLKGAAVGTSVGVVGAAPGTLQVEVITLWCGRHAGRPGGAAFGVRMPRRQGCEGRLPEIVSAPRGDVGTPCCGAVVRLGAASPSRQRYLGGAGHRHDPPALRGASYRSWLRYRAVLAAARLQVGEVAGLGRAPSVRAALEGRGVGFGWRHRRNGRSGRRAAP